MLLYVLIIYLATIITVTAYWIERSHRGDIFSAESTHCSYYNSQCTTWSTGWLWNDCTECQCYDGSTIYKDYCHWDVSRDFLGKSKERLQHPPVHTSKSSHLEVFLRKGVLKKCSKFSEHIFLGTPLGGCLWTSVILFSVTHCCSVYWQATQFIISAGSKNHLRHKNR